MIKAIIFDCFGVLTSAPWKEFLASLPAEQHDSARDLNYSLDSGIISLQDFLKQIEQLTGKSPKLVENIINPGADKNIVLLDYIKVLASSHKISLLSNVSSNWIRDVLLTKNELELFDDMVLSYEVKLIKPDPEIYRLTAERLNCAPEECLMVDDSPVNCSGAEAVGMKSILYTNFTHFKTEVEQLLTNPN